MTSTPIIFLTGATGFVGSAIALELLNSTPYVVRQAVRTEAQVDAWNAKYPQWKERVQFVVVKDFAKEGAFDEALQGTDGVIHTASPATFTPEDNRRDLLDPAINSILSILRSAQKVGTVKTFVLTSSTAAYIDAFNPPKPEEVVTDKYWNPMTYEEAAAMPKDKGMYVYRASKVLGEKAAWNFVEKEKPNFNFTTIAPTWVLGHNDEPSLKSWADFRSTFGLTAMMLIDKKEFPPTGPHDVRTTFVDVKDVAKAHVGALLHPEKANGKRYLVVGGRFSHEMAAHYFAKAVPEAASRLAGTEKVPFPKGFEWDATAAENDFDLVYTPLEKTITSWAQQIFSLPEKA